ncbi:MAG: hypothetical protein U5N21_13270 [Rhodococcus sp. (in: high G+C Gram-positive bacteria)]|nr:hypothetical protein [Rhodococcus sp. (in: high G+C Gram-positive bacteria)]
MPTPPRTASAVGPDQPDVMAASMPDRKPSDPVVAAADKSFQFLDEFSMVPVPSDPTMATICSCGITSNASVMTTSVGSNSPR